MGVMVIWSTNNSPHFRSSYAIGIGGHGGGAEQADGEVEQDLQEVPREGGNTAGPRAEVHPAKIERRLCME